jgi:hypothetical protein
MAHDASAPAPRLLAASGLAIAMLMLAIVVAGPQPASASHAGYVDVGSTANSATATTGVSTTVGNGLQGVSNDQSASGVYGENTFGGFGVAGRSLNSVLCGVQPCMGVRGEGEGTGVSGLGTAPGATGVAGAGSTGVLGDGNGTVPTTGVHGQGTTGVRAIGENDQGSTGVFATSESGVGVRGHSDFGAGIRGYGGTLGIEAESPTKALSVIGKSSFSRSGMATVPAGRMSVVVPGVDLDPTSMVLATLQQNRKGTWIKAAVPNAVNDTTKIQLSRRAPRPTRVAWFVIELP